MLSLALHLFKVIETGEAFTALLELLVITESAEAVAHMGRPQYFVLLIWIRAPILTPTTGLFRNLTHYFQGLGYHNKHIEAASQLVTLYSHLNSMSERLLRRITQGRIVCTD